nr:LysR family transcriptional regulator [Ancylobacter sp. 3268]
MDRLKAMEIFVRVVETGSLSKAAKALGLPRSSVTITIQRLEQHLGVRLLHRSTRQLRLGNRGPLRRSNRRICRGGDRERPHLSDQYPGRRRRRHRSSRNFLLRLGAANVGGRPCAVLMFG